MTSKQALAERARLEKERRAATIAVDTTRGELQRLQRDLDRANEARIKAYQRLARGQEESKAAVDRAEGERAELLGAVDRAQAAYEGAGQARTAVEQELARLLSEELPAFAAEADRLTRRADEALTALEEPYRAAVQAWQEAANAWAPLQPAIHAAVESVQDEIGIWRDRALVHNAASVPPLPLPLREGWERLPTARPPAMEPESGQVSRAPKGAVSTGARS